MTVSSELALRNLHRLTKSCKFRHAFATLGTTKVKVTKTEA